MSVTRRIEGIRRVDVRSARDVFLENVVLNRAVQGAGVDALLPGNRDVEREQYRRRGVYRHGGANAVERDALEQRLHVCEAADGNAGASDLALGHGVIGVVSCLRGQVEGDAQTGLPVFEQVAVASVGLLRRRQASVLAHSPEPTAVHGRLYTARVGVLAGVAEVVRVVRAIEVLRGVQDVFGDAGGCLEGVLTLTKALENGVECGL